MPTPAAAATAARDTQQAPALPAATPVTVKTQQAQQGKKAKTGRSVPAPSFAFMSSSTDAAAAGRVGPEASGTEARADAEHRGGVEAFATAVGCEGHRKVVTTQISVEELHRSLPATLITDVLPQPFADHLLHVFLKESQHWHTSKRWLYDKEIESHRLESGFRFDNGGCPTARGFGRRWEAAGFGDDLRHLRGVVAGAVRRTRMELRNAWRAPQRGAGGAECDRDALSPSELAQETVAFASRGQRVRMGNANANWFVQYAEDFAQQGGRWEPNYCVANYYKDEGDFLGAHSDPIESIGPWAIVASLTLGAARQFRMKPVGTLHSSLGGGGGRVTSYSVRLPHNSLLILWEGFQEFWRHEVPKDRGLARHPISGAARLNFTFRRSAWSVARRRPLCSCGRKAHLKPVLKETSAHRGRYFWSCPNPRVKKGTYSTCDFFQWDDDVIKEQRAAQATGVAGSCPKGVPSALPPGPQRQATGVQGLRVAQPRGRAPATRPAGSGPVHVGQGTGPPTFSRQVRAEHQRAAAGPSCLPPCAAPATANGPCAAQAGGA